jgi:hypothetical protein
MGCVGMSADAAGRSAGATVEQENAVRYVGQ